MRFDITTPQVLLDAALDAVGAALGPAKLDAVFRQILEVVRVHLVRETMARLDKDPTGTLARSWSVLLQVAPGGGWTGGVGTMLPYARIHNEGGVIRPVRGRYLALPLRPTVPRGMMPRTDPTPMRIHKSKRGNLLLVEDRPRQPGQPEKITPRYLLRSSVTMPPTFYVQVAAQAAAPEAEALLYRLVESALQAG